MDNEKSKKLLEFINNNIEELESIILNDSDEDFELIIDLMKKEIRNSAEEASKIQNDNLTPQLKKSSLFLFKFLEEYEQYKQQKINFGVLKSNYLKAFKIWGQNDQIQSQNQSLANNDPFKDLEQNSPIKSKTPEINMNVFDDFNDESINYQPNKFQPKQSMEFQSNFGDNSKVENFWNQHSMTQEKQNQQNFFNQQDQSYSINDGNNKNTSQLSNHNQEYSNPFEQQFQQDQQVQRPNDVNQFNFYDQNKSQTSQKDIKFENNDFDNNFNHQSQQNSNQKQQNQDSFNRNQVKIDSQSPKKQNSVFNDPFQDFQNNQNNQSSIDQSNNIINQQYKNNNNHLNDDSFQDNQNNQFDNDFNNQQNDPLQQQKIEFNQQKNESFQNKNTSYNIQNNKLPQNEQNNQKIDPFYDIENQQTKQQNNMNEWDMFNQMQNESQLNDSNQVSQVNTSRINQIIVNQNDQNSIINQSVNSKNQQNNINQQQNPQVKPSWEMFDQMQNQSQLNDTSQISQTASYAINQKINQDNQKMKIQHADNDLQQQNIRNQQINFDDMSNYKESNKESNYTENKNNELNKFANNNQSQSDQLDFWNKQKIAEKLDQNNEIKNIVYDQSDNNEFTLDEVENARHKSFDQKQEKQNQNLDKSQDKYELLYKQFQNLSEEFKVFKQNKPIFSQNQELQDIRTNQNSMFNKLQNMQDHVDQVQVLQKKIQDLNQENQNIKKENQMIQHIMEQKFVFIEELLEKQQSSPKSNSIKSYRQENVLSEELLQNINQKILNSNQQFQKQIDNLNSQIQSKDQTIDKFQSIIEEQSKELKEQKSLQTNFQDQIKRIMLQVNTLTPIKQNLQQIAEVQEFDLPNQENKIQFSNPNQENQMLFSEIKQMSYQQQPTSEQQQQQRTPNKNIQDIQSQNLMNTNPNLSQIKQNMINNRVTWNYVQGYTNKRKYNEKVYRGLQTFYECLICQLNTSLLFFKTDLINFKNACLNSCSILFENMDLQIGVRVSFSYNNSNKNAVRLALYYINKQRVSLGNFQARINIDQNISLQNIQIEPEYLRLQDIHPEQDVGQTFIMSDLIQILKSNKLPSLSINYIQQYQKKQVDLKIPLPLTLNRFLDFKQINESQFNLAWMEYNDTLILNPPLQLTKQGVQNKNDALNEFKMHLPGLLEFSSQRKTLKLGGYFTIFEKFEFLLKIIVFNGCVVVFQIERMNHEQNKLHIYIQERLLSHLSFLFCEIQS